MTRCRPRLLSALALFVLASGIARASCLPVAATDPLDDGDREALLLALEDDRG